MPAPIRRPLSATVLAAFALTSGAFATPALALGVVDQVLQVSYKYKGTDYVFNDTYVPLLPGNACYTWYIQSDAPDTELVFVENLQLPAPIDWGTAATDPNDGVEISSDGMRADSTITATTDADGWFSHGWCVAAGDPVGSHSMTVSLAGTQLAVFDFEVLAADQYVYPATADRPWAARSASRVW